MFRPGQVVGGRYEIIVLIGERSLAAVFRAKDRQTGREWALKAVRPNFITKVGAQAMQREAQVAKMIGQNASVVEVIDMGYDDALGTPYMIMPLLSGETLQQRIARAGALPPEEVQRYAGQLGFALDKAHQVGVVHGALSPSKIFLTRDARQDPLAMILDFGVGKILDNHPQAAVQLSHAAYLAPEQLSADAKRMARSLGARIADAVTGAADTWAIGLIMYEALTGAPAGAFWSVTKAQEIAMRIVQRPPVPSHAAGVSASLLPMGFDEWFKRCVHLEPSRRFARASDATNELVTLLDQLVPKPSTNLGGAVKTFLVGGADPSAIDPATVATPPPVVVNVPPRMSHPTPMPSPSPMFTPSPASVSASSPQKRILETALAIPDHEVSRNPPMPAGRPTASSVHEAAAAPSKGNALIVAVVVLVVALLGVGGVLVVLLMKK